MRCRINHRAPVSSLLFCASDLNRCQTLASGFQAFLAGAEAALRLFWRSPSDLPSAQPASKGGGERAGSGKRTTPQSSAVPERRGPKAEPPAWRMPAGGAAPRRSRAAAWCNRSGAVCLGHPRPLELSVRRTRSLSFALRAPRLYVGELGHPLGFRLRSAPPQRRALAVRRVSGRCLQPKPLRGFPGSTCYPSASKPVPDSREK